MAEQRDRGVPEEGPVVPGSVDDVAEASDASRMWHAPEITRIDLRRTMFRSGSPVDGAATGTSGG
jgi:hypothetical protein